MAQAVAGPYSMTFACHWAKLENQNWRSWPWRCFPLLHFLPDCAFFPLPLADDFSSSIFLRLGAGSALAATGLGGAAAGLSLLSFFSSPFFFVAGSGGSGASAGVSVPGAAATAAVPAVCGSNSPVFSKLDFACFAMASFSQGLSLFSPCLLSES